MDTVPSRETVLWSCLVEDIGLDEWFRVRISVSASPAIHKTAGPVTVASRRWLSCSCSRPSSEGAWCEHVELAKTARISEMRSQHELWTVDDGYEVLARQAASLYAKIRGMFYIGQEILYTATIEEAMSVLAENPESVNVDSLERELFDKFGIIITPGGYFASFEEVEDNWKRNEATGHSRLYGSLPNWKCYACGASGSHPYPSDMPCK